MTHSRANVFELTRAIAGARLGRRPPIYLVHALTARCNARCGFCAWSPDFYDPRQQLSTDAIEQLYTDARRAGFVGLSIWGGEPLLHRDFARIAAHAHGLGLATNMVTNGFLLEQKMDAVVRHIDRVCISVDHPSSRHDEIRAIPRLFEKIVSATAELRRRQPDKQIIYICTIQRANADAATMRAMCELLRKQRVLGIFNGLREQAASADADALIAAHAPSDEALGECFSTLTELKRLGYPILNSGTHLRAMKNGPPVYRCHWPKFMLPIEANGDVVDCMDWGTRPIGNVTRAPFAELLLHPRLAALAGSEGERCHKCVSIHRVEISEVCSGNLEPIRAWQLLRKVPAAHAGAAAR